MKKKPFWCRIPGAHFFKERAEATITPDGRMARLRIFCPDCDRETIWDFPEPKLDDGMT